jgi:hypothetical protein
VPRLRRAGIAAAIAATPFALAYRFAVVYRRRAGFPRPRPPSLDPSALGLAFEDVVVPSPGTTGLPGWFLPARGGEPGPGVALVHGWESARDRTLPIAEFLIAAGFHCLTIDVRGHGSNPPETLPVSAGEFGTDALAAFEALVARPEVTVGAIAGHSLGGIGALLAGAADPRVAAVVATSAPAEPNQLTRLTFRLANLPIPDPVAVPLAWLTTRVYLRPRGHQVRNVSASMALATTDEPVLLIHGAADDVVPSAHLGRLLAAAERSGRPDPVERITTNDGFTGVQVGGRSPKVAVFGRGPSGRVDCGFASTHEGTGMYLVTGLAPGRYSLTKNGQPAGEYNVSGRDEAVAFDSASGTFELHKTGEAPPPKVTPKKLPLAKVGAAYRTTLLADEGIPPEAVRAYLDEAHIAVRDRIAVHPIIFRGNDGKVDHVARAGARRRGWRSGRSGGRSGGRCSFGCRGSGCRGSGFFLFQLSC